MKNTRKEAEGIFEMASKPYCPGKNIKGQGLGYHVFHSFLAKGGWV